ncbi:hypothetical protein F5B20DRAFT_576641 [Whalleya microplaca]|nr:hypothetical protein F5B20DRAFT_576641 [Whalleya microplaca]
MAPPKGRARFQEDLKAAAEKDIANVSGMNKGDAENEFVFIFGHPLLPTPSGIEIRIQPQDIGGYPNENSFLAYTNSDVPANIGRELEESMYKTTGMKVEGMLSDLIRRLRATLEGNEAEAKTDSVISDADASDFDEDEPYDSNEDVPFTYDDDPFDLGVHYVENSTAQAKGIISPYILERARRDLHSVLRGGFRAGKINGFEFTTDHSIVSTSVRVSKLGLSEETREAWKLASSDYIVLLIQYEGCYSSFEDIIQRATGLSGIKFRLRKCSRRKPSLQQALAAFSPDSSRKSSSLKIPTAQPDDPVPKNLELSHFWIGESIDNLMNGEFIPMMKLRHRLGGSWDSAKERYSKFLKSAASAMSNSEDGVVLTEEEKEVPSNGAQIPTFLTADHLVSGGEISFPLVATQFVMHYLVRCSNYCMICHQKVEGNFESLKPYVCGDPLCLFQYMSLGLGPSIDHEIINQPYVVDLLISFCYASVCGSRFGKASLREFPRGLNLQVPKIRTKIEPDSPLSPRSIAIMGGVLIEPICVDIDWDASTATIVGDYNEHDLREGRWIILSTNLVTLSEDSNSEAQSVLHHARIEWKYNSLLQFRVVSRHTMPMTEVDDEALISSGSECNIRGQLVLCDQDLDELDNEEKAFSMEILLCTLPSVMDMRSHLMSNPFAQLAKWDRMTPAAMGLLRWIVASNRSYIVQVDERPDANENSLESKLGRQHERISGVDGWMQFRFAQGSPEKEALFNEALELVNKPQRSLVAWHGSPLENWHSIIRQGLNYTVTANGRSFGDGVYFSRDFDYSLGYTGGGILRNWSNAHVWPQSALKVGAAISLNELVNLPENFQNSASFFVVQHCHWIQCRYLFIKPRHQEEEVSGGTRPTSDAVSRKAKKDKGHESEVAEFIQDLKWVTTGPSRSALYIPEIAIPSAQYGRKTSTASLNKAAREHHLDSSDDDEDDIRFIFNPKADDNQASKPYHVGDLPPTPTQQEPQTDFRPGTLDFSSLPQLAPPSYATEIAQRTLGKEIKKLQQTQSTTPLHELGWYIYFERMNNMFQWIVELHSFDPSLPLAQDMKAAGVTSIILEIRFLRHFPISPPFIRVVRPRFLPFMNGGGGHVTVGGAMCMELLTNTGWSPANSIENVLFQVRMAISSTDPQPARLEKAYKNSTQQYGVTEAVQAYTRAANAHGWEVPMDLHEATTQMPDVSD